ncbi:tyrosine-type recombinase/integrase [Streptomyces albus]|uniref:tyrosine-type recombinase/integrase n=1 Tax=Streptomyces sp. PHES57 TaxID=2872626 RepID=UPI001CED61EC|nr:tyrosine-type recombinase/integrase [Streptomyces sp. PHES57]
MPQRLEHITPAAMEALLDDRAIPVAHRALWALLRDEVALSDCLALDVQDIDLHRRTAHVSAPTKGDDSVTVPLGARAVSLLRDAIGNRTDGQALRISRSEAVRQARDLGHSIHAFRAALPPGRSAPEPQSR